LQSLQVSLNFQALKSSLPGIALGAYFIGGSVKPARSFDPSVVSHQFHSYHWIYWAGPILGALLASGFYKFIKMLEYETANPGQDAAKPGEHFNPDLEGIDLSHAPVSFPPGDYAMEEGRVGTRGTPREYGTERRPFTDRPAPPHPNDTVAGLADGGMHVDELAKPTRMRQSGTSLDWTLTDSEQHQLTIKSAIKPGGGGSMAAGKERSVRSNSSDNRNMNSGIPRDEDFYDKD
jgi:aquaporin related protein